MTERKKSLKFEHAGLVLAMAVASGIAHLGTSTMPFQVGALMDGRGLSASAAGLFGFFEIGALALSMVLIAPVIDRFRSVSVAMAGAALAVAAHLAMLPLSTSIVALMVCAAIAGSGYGMVFAAAITGASTARNPDRIYALGNGGGIVFVVAMMLVIPVASSRLGPMGAFPAIAIMIALASPAMLAFRTRPIVPDVARGQLANRPAVIGLLVMWAGYSLGTGALWSFAERIGKSLAIGPELIATILSASTLCGVLGALIAALSGSRTFRLYGMIAGLVGTGVSCLLLGFANGTVMFALGVLTYWIFYMFQYSLFLGAAATLDPEGRVGTLGGGCERFAFAIGAPIGGVIADHASFSLIGVLGFASCVLTIPFCMPAVMRALNARGGVQASSVSSNA